MPYVQISRICALSIGENYAAEKLASMVGGDVAVAVASALRASPTHGVVPALSRDP